MCTPKGLRSSTTTLPSVACLPLLYIFMAPFVASSCKISLHILSQIVTGPLSVNYRVIRDYAIMSASFCPCQRLMDEVWLQALRLTRWDTHRHIQVVISRSSGVLLDKGAVVAIPLAAVSPTPGRHKRARGGGEEPRRGGESEVAESSRAGKLFRCINLANKRTRDTHLRPA